MFEKLRKSIAKAVAPKRVRTPSKAKSPSPLSPGGRGRGDGVRMYHAARASRLTSGFQVSNTSADSELVSSLTTLRSRSRALVRDASYAKRAKVIIQNNVIGSGIGLQSQVMTTRDALNDRVNDAIEEAFCQWAKPSRCHTGGSLHFADLERAAMGQVFEAGEILFREHYRAFGDSAVPYALEMIEPERIADGFAQAGPLRVGGTLRMGVEVDDFYRPLGYFIRKRHPSEFRLGVYETDAMEWVPAEQIIHLRIIDRWPQTRGEPWLHTVVRKLNDMDAYSEAEVIAARGAAQYLNWIETPEADHPLAQPVDPANPNGEKEVVVEPGMTLRGAPGEKFNSITPNRPNTALDPFMRYMLREVAAGCGVSYESLSRDYSQSNYSSSRLALLDDRDLWRMLQLWFIRCFRERVHARWLQQAVFARAIIPIGVEEYGANPGKFEAALYKPRGWGWIDPTKEVEAYEKALKAGFTTRRDIISASADGRDIEDIDRQRAREIENEKTQGLEFTTSPSVYVNEKKAAPAQKPMEEPPPKDESNTTTIEPPTRLVSIQR